MGGVGSAVVKGAKQSESSGQSPTDTAFVTVSDDQVVLDTLKLAEDVDGFVCRFYDASGGARKATVNFPLLKSADWQDPVIVSLLEEELYGIQKVGGNSLSFELSLHPFEIVSVLIKRK